MGASEAMLNLLHVPKYKYIKNSTKLTNHFVTNRRMPEWMHSKARAAVKPSEQYLYSENDGCHETQKATQKKQKCMIARDRNDPRKPIKTMKGDS